MDIITPILTSILGAVLALVGNIFFVELKRIRRYRALLEGIIEECKYDDSILQEILNGSAVNGSFKRTSVDFFKYARESSVANAMQSELVSFLSRACVDLGLFNLQADIILKSTLESNNSAENTDAVKKSIIHAARGVHETLEELKKVAEANHRNLAGFSVRSIVLIAVLVMLCFGQLLCFSHCCRAHRNCLGHVPQEHSVSGISNTESNVVKQLTNK